MKTTTFTIVAEASYLAVLAALAAWMVALYSPV